MCPNDDANLLRVSGQSLDMPFLSQARQVILGWKQRKELKPLAPCGDLGGGLPWHLGMITF
jgi:hypothetical protein